MTTEREQQMTDQAPEGVDPNTGEISQEGREGFDFLMFLNAHRRGQMNLDVTDAMDELVASVMTIGKKGTMTLTLTVVPMDDKLDPIVIIEDEVKVKPPKRKADGAHYFLQTADGQISRNAPQQPIPGFEYMKED